MVLIENATDRTDRLDAYFDGSLEMLNAIAGVLDDGIRTADIMSEGKTRVGTTEMGDAILAKFKALAA